MGQGRLCPHPTPDPQTAHRPGGTAPDTSLQKGQKSERKELRGTGGRRHSAFTPLPAHPACLLGRAVLPSSPHLAPRSPPSLPAPPPRFLPPGLTFPLPPQEDSPFLVSFWRILPLHSRMTASPSLASLPPLQPREGPPPHKGSSRSTAPLPRGYSPHSCPFLLSPALPGSHPSDSLRSPLPSSLALPSSPSSPEPGSLRLLPRRLHLSN